MKSSALTVIHKYIREELFGVSRKLSCMAADDAGAARQAIDEVAELLRGHAAHEDAAFGPLLQDIDASFAATMHDDHKRLDEQLEQICAAARALETLDTANSLRLYLDWNRFTSAYLQHLDDEERALFPALGDRLPPVEFVAEGIAARGEVDGQAFLQKLGALITPGERTTIEQALAAR